MGLAELADWEYNHRFQINHPLGQRKTTTVMLLAGIMMLAEIIAGLLSHSMALFAEGWHMSTHVTALGIAVFAYYYAEKHREDPRFSFGPGKISALGGFSSALVLAMVAGYMIFGSVVRFFHPQTIAFNQAIGVASLGFIMNVASAWLLRDEPIPEHLEGHEHHHAHGHDLNLRSAFFHVLADAVTSFMAIIALSFGKIFHWNWPDSMMGMVGGLVVGQWAFGLIRDTSRILLDREMDEEIIREIQKTIEGDGNARITDLHLLRVGLAEFAVVLSVISENPQSPGFYKKMLRQHIELTHISVEVHQCSKNDLEGVKMNGKDH